MHVKTADLKNNLSRYLRHIRDTGETILVCDRDRPSALAYADLPPARYADIARENRAWRLRAADAGHFFCFRQLSTVFPGIRMVCFDTEIRAAVSAAGLPLWSAAG